METGDLLELPASFPGKVETSGDDLETGEVNPVEFYHDDSKEKLHESHSQRVLASGNDGSFSVVDVDFHGDLVMNTSDIDMDVDPAEPLRLLGKSDVVGIGLATENGALSLEIMNDATEDESCAMSSSSRKRARMEHDGSNQPSVHVSYKSLESSSRQKLEELLKQWSEWHSQHCSSSLGTGEEVYSGEETIFPALQINFGKTFALSFWSDQQTLRMENEGVISFDTKTVPLYDRGYSVVLNMEDHSSNLEGGLEIMDDAARCFNCGSYSHSLRECPKPRNNVAVNNARKLQRSKRNQNAASRGPARYYQDLPAGKFNGLKPGAIELETRKLLGLGELDPPPWLNRMRELGYPPGYLEVDFDDEPSGIIMYAEEEVKAGGEDGEILETEAGPPKKMMIEFPGINAPIPEDADERRWAAWPPKKMMIEFPGINAPIPEDADERRWTAWPSRSESSRHHRSPDRNSHYSLPINILNVEDNRWSGYTRDDPFPGTEPVLSPQSPILNNSQHARSPTVSLSSYKRGGRSHYEDYSGHNNYSSRGYEDSLHHHKDRYVQTVNEGWHGRSVKEGRHYHDRDYPTEGR